MPHVTTTQNAPAQIRLLRARTQTYSDAMKLMGWQVVLTVLVPVIGSVSTIFITELRPWVAVYSLSIIAMDAIFLDRQYERLLVRAAKICEQFDSIVLELPWNNFLCGTAPDVEDVHRAAKRFASKYSDEKLLDWYPKAVNEVPISFARIVCQRTNLRYDSQLRKSYGVVLAWTGAIILLALVLIALLVDPGFHGSVLALAPLAPIIAWGAREYYRQRDTAALQENLKTRSEAFWIEALSDSLGDDECLTQSRKFQDAIYTRRATSALIMPFLYRFKREGLESEMNIAAEEFVAAYQASQD